MLYPTPDTEMRLNIRILLETWLDINAARFEHIILYDAVKSYLTYVILCAFLRNKSQFNRWNQKTVCIYTYQMIYIKNFKLIIHIIKIIYKKNFLQEFNLVFLKLQRNNLLKSQDFTFLV